MEYTVTGAVLVHFEYNTDVSVASSSLTRGCSPIKRAVGVLHEARDRITSVSVGVASTGTARKGMYDLVAPAILV